MNEELLVAKEHSPVLCKVCLCGGPADSTNTAVPHLSTSSLQWFVRNECVCDLELHVADGLITQRTLTRTPLEALHTQTNTGSRHAGTL
jgi:hypothetical protein